jgi:predicted nucleic acid-binding protein
MKMLLDTNVLLRIAQPAHPQRTEALEATVRLSEAELDLCLVPQVLYEFWSVATRPVSVNGLGMDAAAAERSLDELTHDFHLQRDERGVYGHWRSLIAAHRVRGKNAHDARLVAAMLRHGIGCLLTFNTPDFARFTTIAVYSPTEIVAGRLPV